MLTLIRFSGPWCVVCKALKADRTVENFIKQHPMVELLEANVPSPDDEGTPEDEVANAYNVSGLPALIFEGPDGTEYARHEGEISAMRLATLFREAEGRMQRGQGGRRRRGGYSGIKTKAHAAKDEE